MDRINTLQFPCTGGLITNMDYLQQGRSFPGSAVKLLNFEPSIAGGYTRLSGYQKFDEDEVPGDGDIIGVFVFEGLVVACRGTDIHTSSGSGWTKVNGLDVRTGAGIYRAAQLAFAGTSKIILVDGVNDPASLTSTGTYTVLTDAPAAAEHVAVFKGRAWFAKDNLLTYSASLDEEDFDPANGAGVINVAFDITGVRAFRDQLIIFCVDRIFRLTGATTADFVLAPVTSSFGCTDSDTIIEANSDLYFLGPDGIRTFSATDRNDDFNIANTAKQIQDNVTNLTSNFTRIVSVPIRSKSQVRWFGYSADTPVSVRSGIIGTFLSQGDSQGWVYSETSGIKVNVIDSGLTATGTEVTVFGNNTGYIYTMDSGNTFDGVDITFHYQIPYLSFEDVNQRKSFRKVKVFLQANTDYQLVTQLNLDFGLRNVIQPPPGSITGDSFDTLGSFVLGESVLGGTEFPYGEVMLVGSGFSGSLSFSGQNSLPPFTIKSIALEASFYGRK